MILDILDEHIDEAEDLFERRLLAFDMLDLTGEDLAELDVRLRAHLDGLLLGGEASWNLCRDFLAEGSVGQAFVAGIMACEAPGAPGLQTLIEALPEASPDIKQGIRGACHLTVWPGVVYFLQQQLGSDDADVRAVALDALIYRKEIPAIDVLERALKSSNTAELIAGLQGAAQVDDLRLAPLVEGCLSSNNTDVSAAALEALVLIDPARAVARCHGILSDNAPCPTTAAMLLGVIGNREDIGPLIETTASQVPQVARAAVLALGNLGSPVAVQALIKLLDHPELGGVAGVSLKRMFGEHLPEAEMPPLETAEEEDDSGDWQPDDDLPRLSPQFVQQWWVEQQTRFSAEGRFRIGETFRPGPPSVETPLPLVNYEMMENSFVLKGCL